MDGMHKYQITRLKKKSVTNDSPESVVDEHVPFEVVRSVGSSYIENPFQFLDWISNLGRSYSTGTGTFVTVTTHFNYQWHFDICA